MGKTVEFWFDVGSPAAYLAWHRLPRVAKAADATIDYRPMLLGGVFQATGNQSPMMVPAKAKWMTADLERFATRDGTRFKHNPHFPINTLMLMRAAIGLQMRDPQRFIPFVDTAYEAIWARGLDMNDPGVVAGVLDAAGFEPQSVLALTADPQVKEKLKAVTAEAVERGIFGAPAFFVDGTLYWGQDRIDFVEEALRKD